MLDSFLAKRDGFRAWLSGWGSVVNFSFRVCGSLRVSGGLRILFVCFFYSSHGFRFAWCWWIDDCIQLATEFVVGIAAVAVDDDWLTV